MVHAGGHTGCPPAGDPWQCQRHGALTGVLVGMSFLRCVSLTLEPTPSPARSVLFVEKLSGAGGSISLVSAELVPSVCIAPDGRWESASASALTAVSSSGSAVMFLPLQTAGWAPSLQTEKWDPSARTSWRCPRTPRSPLSSRPASGGCDPTPSRTGSLVPSAVHVLLGLDSEDASARKGRDVCLVFLHLSDR